MAGCFCAGKLVQKLNQNLFIGASLLVMAGCLYATPFCGNLTTLSVAMVLHGVFSGFFTVGNSHVPSLFFIHTHSVRSRADRVFLKFQVCVQRENKWVLFRAQPLLQKQSGKTRCTFCNKVSTLFSPSVTTKLFVECVSLLLPLRFILCIMESNFHPFFVENFVFLFQGTTRLPLTCGGRRVTPSSRRCTSSPQLGAS